MFSAGSKDTMRKDEMNLINVRVKLGRNSSKEQKVAVTENDVQRFYLCY